MNGDTSADGAAIGFGSDQFHFDPMIGLIADVIAQQGRGLVQINDQDVDIPVVVEVAVEGDRNGYRPPVPSRSSRAELVGSIVEPRL